MCLTGYWIPSAKYIRVVDIIFVDVTLLLGLVLSVLFGALFCTERVHPCMKLDFEHSLEVVDVTLFFLGVISSVPLGGHSIVLTRHETRFF